MIYYNELPLAPEILKALEELEINYVFQPIFYPDGKTIFAHEALMRPQGTTVVDLIEEYTKRDELHVLEVATFWGATQAFFLRGYKEKLSINSFPCECFSKEETQVFVDYFGSDRNRLIIEQLEYPTFDLDIAMKKKAVAAVGDSMLALDDYGAGINDMDMVKLMEPHIVKLDRTLISDIDTNVIKQKYVMDTIEKLHDLGGKIVAEGVETKEEFDYLVNAGVDYLQGYYLARPA